MTPLLAPVFTMFALVVAATPSNASSADGITLSVAPPHVYKLADAPRGQTESWMFYLIVKDARDRRELRPVRAQFDLYHGDVLRETTILPESTLIGRRQSFTVTPGMDTVAYQRRLVLDETFDLRRVFLSRPAAWQCDRVRAAITLASAGSEEIVKTIDVPLSTYTQKTRLRFPIAGPAMVSQGAFNDLGHSGPANHFALDFLGLDASYGPWVKGGEGNTGYVGFGMEIHAPAAGRVVYARSDVPDNTGDVDPLSVYRTLPDPIGAVGGNSVVIDHGNGEFSVLMHMQQGSVTVKSGDTIEQGQVIGRLGNSGDAFGPHLHYQLQDGPDLLRAWPLPLEFENLQGTRFARGVYLTPK